MHNNMSGSNILSFKKMDAKSYEDIAMNLLNLTLSTLKFRDPYTAIHHSKVADISMEIGKILDMDEERIQGLYISAMLHDIGKIGVPLSILNKPGILSPHEYEAIKAHVQIGMDIFDNVKLPWPVYSVISQHHERLDGSGYPNNLKGDKICLEARIVAVTDVFDAVSFDRPYRKKLGEDHAINTIEKGKNIKYDGDVCDALMKWYKATYLK